MNSSILITPTISTGQTLDELAASNNTTAAAIMAVNPGASFLPGMGTNDIANAQLPSTYIIIPGRFDDTDYYFYYTPQRGDTLNSIAKNFGLPLACVIQQLPQSYQPPAFSADQPVPTAIGSAIYIVNLAYPGVTLPVVAPSTAAAPQMVTQNFIPTDTISSLAKELGVSVYDLVNSNSFLAAGFVTNTGEINSEQPIGTSGQVGYPNVLYPGYVPSIALSPTSVSLGNVTPEPVTMPSVAPPEAVAAILAGPTVSGSITVSPVILYGAVALGLAGILAFFMSRSSR